MKKFAVWSLAFLAATVTSLLSAGAVQTPSSAAKDIQGSEQVAPSSTQDTAPAGEEDQDEIRIIEEEEECEDSDQEVKDAEIQSS